VECSVCIVMVDSSISLSLRYDSSIGTMRGIGQITDLPGSRSYSFYSEYGPFKG
jgi:hypothetical protein